MGTSYVRQSSMADGDTITAALFNDEFNRLLTAFSYASSSTTGHQHDGTAGEGGNIHTIGDQDFLNKILTTSNTWEFYVEVSSAAAKQMVLQDGALVPNADSDLDLGTSSKYFKDAYIDSITTTGNVSVGGNLTVTGTTTFNGGTLTLGDAADDNVVFGADVNSNIIPNTDSAYDLGSSSQEWRDLYIDGTAYLDAINFNGTAISATAAEINILDGVTATASELNIMDGVTATTAELNIMDGVTSTAAELNILDGVTSSTAELNILDGVTSTTAELNLLDGVTATTAELNILDGVTSTAAELNILDGVTSTAAELNTLDGVTAVVGELNYLDLGSTAVGTAVASKAVVLDSNKDYTGIRNLTLSGDLTISGDDLTMGTNTSGHLLIADGTNFNPTAVGDLSEISTVANDDVLLAVDTSGGGLKKIARSTLVSGLASSGAISNVADDSTPQLGGDLDVNGNALTSTSNGNIALTPNGTGVVRLDGNVDIQSGEIVLKNAGSVSNVKFYCESSNAHYTQLQSAAHSDYSGNVTLTLPPSTDTLVGKATTDTLTNKTLTSPVLNTGVSGSAVLDEDNMASDSATKLATQQSIKAYVDSQVDSTEFVLEDDDGTEVTVSNAKEVKFIGSGITTNWTDTDNGTDGDPYDLTFTVDAAQTGITSLLATDIKIGEDDQTKIDFEDADKINFYAGNEKQLILEDGALYPGSDNIIDLGKSDNEFKDAFFDGTVTADAFAGPLTGDVTGNVSGTAATVTGAAQSNITSLGTLTTLTVDNVIVNGTTIGHTDDTDLITLADGIATVAGEISVTTLDIGGTNVTSTAAELNILDGVTSTATELNILDGVTSTTAELNILDGVTSTAAELNILDGVTATTAELNYLDLATLGSTAASKVVSADANNVVRFTGGIHEEAVTVTSSSNATTVNLRDGTNFLHTLTENTTFTFSNPPTEACIWTLKIVQDSSARTITWPNTVDWPAATAPTLTSSNAGVDVFVFLTNDGGTIWYGFTAGQAMG